jgi:nucleoside-diphosphate-sugar epimerase
MKIFVTGANGFVGQHLCTHLLQAGHEVTAAVRNAGAAPDGTSEVVVADIGPATRWDGLLGGHDAVIHLAARVHVMHETSADPLADFREVNSAGTENLARSAAASGISQFVFLSSIKVNGEETVGRAYDANSEPAPVDPYGISKHEAEQALAVVARETDMGVVIVRTPLVFGPGVGGNFVRMLSIARRNVPLPLASVRNRRSMVSIWNLSDLLERAAIDPAASGALVIAGDTRSPSTPDLLRIIGAAMGVKPRLIAFPVGVLAWAAGLLGKGPEIHRLVSSLEVVAGSSSNGWLWSPKMEFTDGIKRTVEWYEASHAPARNGEVSR